jgi:hypothetical protein
LTASKTPYSVFNADLGGLDCNNSAALYSHEAPYYARAASLTLDVVPSSGHDLNLHRSAGESFALIDDCLTSH